MKYLEGTFSIHPMSELAADILSALLADAGFETFVPTETGLTAYVQDAVYDDAIVNRTIEDFPLSGVSITYDMVEAENRNWNEEWETTGFKPIAIDDRLLVCAPNAEDQHENFQRVLYIEPRQAFGSGTHATTQMLLSRLLDINLKGLTVIDAGCGTGILGLLCAMQGASDVFAYDIDEWSVDNTLHNAILNNITNIKAVIGDAAVLSGLQPCDLLLANINRNILIGDMPHFAEAVSQNGTLLLSGFLEDDVNLLVECAESNGFAFKEKFQNAEWRMLEFRKL